MEYIIDLAIKGYLSQFGIFYTRREWATGEAALWMDDLLTGAKFDCKKEANGQITVMVVRAVTTNNPNNSNTVH